MSRIDWRNRRRYIGAGVIAAVFVTPAGFVPPTPNGIHRYQPLPSWKIEQRHIKPFKAGGGPPVGPGEIFGIEDEEEIIMLLSAFIEVMNRNHHH